MTTRRSIAAVLGPTLALWLVAPGVASAQASPSPTVGFYCVLTAEEVADLIGSTATFVVGSGDEQCSYAEEGRFESGYAHLALHPTGQSDLDFAEVSLPDGREVEVAGFPAWFGTQGGRAVLHVDTGEDVILLDLTPGTELEPTLERVQPIAEVAIPRVVAALDALRGPRTDAELAQDELGALFPARLGGERLDVTGLAGAEFLLQIPEDQRPLLEEALATQGKTLDDLIVGVASLDAGGSILALRVRGAVASDLVEPLLQAIFPVGAGITLTPDTVGRRSVLTMSAPGGSGPGYVYPSGDIVWIVIMGEPLATEALGMLP